MPQFHIGRSGRKAQGEGRAVRSKQVWVTDGSKSGDKADVGSSLRCALTSLGLKAHKRGN